MLHPYQCLLHCYRPDLDVKGVVVAASGPNIHTFNSSNGNLISIWPSTQEGNPWNRELTGGRFDEN